MNETATRIVGTATGEIVFLGFPMNDDDRNRWCHWVRQHGIDPHGAIGFFEIDRETRKIRWLAYNLTDKGARFLRPDGKWASTSMREIHLDRPIADLPDARSDSTADAEDFPWRGLSMPDTSQPYFLDQIRTSGSE